MSQPATSRLPTIAHMAAISREILAEIEASHQPITVFNDDDWYIYRESDRELIEVIPVKRARDLGYSMFCPPQVDAGEKAVKGMVAKHLGLWTVVV